MIQESVEEEDSFEDDLLSDFQSQSSNASSGLPTEFKPPELMF